MFKVVSRWDHGNAIKVEWNLGKRCNYDCSYCPSFIHDKTSAHTDIIVLKRTIDTLVSIGRPIRLSFTGGEPTVHPKFEELIHYAQSKGIDWISVTTNGTRKASWYLAQTIQQWVFSLHFEYDWQKVADTIVTTAVNWQEGIVVNVMAHHDLMPQLRTVVQIFDEHKIPHGIRRIRWTEGDHDIFDDMKYAKDDLDWILSRTSTVKSNVIIDDSTQYHANDVIKLHLNKFKDWQCSAGLESLMINWDGDVHRATCRVGGSLGNMYDGTFTMPNTPVTCDRNYCTCAADIPITKLR